MKLKNKRDKKQTQYLFASSNAKSDDLEDKEDHSFNMTSSSNTQNESSIDFDQKKYLYSGIICTKSMVIIVDALFLVSGRTYFFTFK